MIRASPAAGPPPLASERDIRPIVALRRDRSSPLLFAALAAVAAVLLFLSLDARRRALSQAEAQKPNGLAIVAPQQVPALIVPPGFDAPLDSAQQGDWQRPNILSRQSTPSETQFISNTVPRSVGVLEPQPRYLPPVSSTPMVISEGQSPGSLPTGGANLTQPGQQGTLASSRRVKAGRLENPATTVPFGTLITAVLETALDSSAAGQARAVVTRDVAGFDGSRILIPRGTRLYGLYESNVAQGQNRAQIRWSRLLRPDGVTMEIDSPAADPMGRTGVRGRVNSHFFERLGNAVLSTTVNLGAALAARSSSPVIVAVPNGTQSSGVFQNPDQIRSTLTVKPGTRVSVFVQHDLDFSSVDGAP